MSSWGGYSGSWSGSWGSSSVNVNPGGGSSGSWNTPYSSGTWGSGGSSSNTNTQNTNNDKQAEAPAPNTVYYNGNGVLVQKLPDGTTQTVVKNEYTDVNVNSGRRRY